FLSESGKSEIGLQIAAVDDVENWRKIKDSPQLRVELLSNRRPRKPESEIELKVIGFFLSLSLSLSLSLN
ncbi:unnamed protein product, partial [marine sediment metagenome]